MQLGDERESENVEDRRGSGGGFGGGGGGLNLGVAGGGIGAVVIVVVGLLLGVDPSQLLSAIQGDEPAPQTQNQPQRPPMERGQGQNPSQNPNQTAGTDDAQRRFVAQVLATTEDSWGRVFQTMNRRYEPPRLVLYSGETRSACGRAESAVGPFYCPEDRVVYLDLAFFRDMERRLGAPGEFARAYVIAHEVGHHVQTLLGTMQRVQAPREQGDQRQSNAISVQIELQADCYAGVWANVTNRERHFMEAGDIESGLGAAAAVGDDRLQQAAGRRVVPESFTHGSSAQRVSWFRRGFDSGDIKSCDTFAAGG